MLQPACQSHVKRFDMGPQILKKFYSCTIVSIMTGCITAWYGNTTALYRKALQRAVGTVQYIIVAKFPAIQDLYIRRSERMAWKIVKNSSHPSHRLFFLRQHDKWYRCIKSDTNRLLNSFYPQTIRLLNS